MLFWRRVQYSAVSEKEYNTVKTDLSIVRSIERRYSTETIVLFELLHLKFLYAFWISTSPFARSSSKNLIFNASESLNSSYLSSNKRDLKLWFSVILKTVVTIDIAYLGELGEWWRQFDVSHGSLGMDDTPKTPQS